MCAGRGEGPSLLEVLVCLFPLGHCSLNTGCRSMAHSSNSAARLWEKQEKDFPGRNLLRSERFYLGCREGEEIEEPGVGLVDVLGRVQQLFSSWWWQLAMFADPALCHVTLGRGRQGQGPAAPWHSSELMLSCKCWICWKSGCIVPSWSTVLSGILMGLWPCSALHSFCGWWDTLGPTVTPETGFQSKYT